MLFRPLLDALGFISIYQSINLKFFELPQCFPFDQLTLYATQQIANSIYLSVVSKVSDEAIGNREQYMYTSEQ